MQNSPKTVVPYFREIQQYRKDNDTNPPNLSELSSKLKGIMHMLEKRKILSS